jgi:predicted aspartyl protease
MRRRFTYDGRFDPPAPVLPLRVAAPGSQEALLLLALVDTGADCTLVPRSVARQLGLPRVDRLSLEGIDGVARWAPVHAAVVQFAGRRLLAPVVSWGEDAIMGRDLANRVVALLDGPGRIVSIRPAGG